MVSQVCLSQGYNIQQQNFHDDAEQEELKSLKGSPTTIQIALGSCGPDSSWRQGPAGVMPNWHALILHFQKPGGAEQWDLYKHEV